MKRVYVNEEWCLIRNRTPLDRIDFGAVKREPSLLPFGKNWRAQKLGGVV